MRLVTVFRRELPLSYFHLEDLRRMRGWEDAFATTIGDLEAAGLAPSDLPDDGRRLRDLRVIWEALAESAGTSWTRARVFAEAASALEARPERWLFEGPVIASVRGDVTAVESRFLRAIPNATLVLLAGRPRRIHHLERLQALVGPEAADALSKAEVPRSEENECELLASYLFESPEVLADSKRRRSSGRDGTVDFEEHAGLEAEIEAAADWVAREVIEKGTPLEDIAILVPKLDPVAGMLVARIGRIPWEGGTLPIHIPGGLPASSLAAGARALAVIRALGAYLSVESLAEVLPTLRTAEQSRHLARGAALDLAYSLGTVGGNVANPRGALDWVDRARKREADLAPLLEKARAAGDEAEHAGLARQARDIERLLGDLRAVRPAIEALVDVARLVVEGAPLSTVWPALCGFLKEGLPGEGAPIHTLIDTILEGACADQVCASLAGEDALRVIEEALLSLRVPLGKFGDPAVFVGTIDSAQGIAFTAVRVMGLLEGSLPSSPAEDPVLPDQLRKDLGDAVPRAADRALAQLHALDRVVRDVRRSVVLSSPRLDLEQSQHEPSSVFIEAAAAIGRPNAVSGEPAKPIPGASDLRHHYFRPARGDMLRFRGESPLTQSAWQDRVAAVREQIPSEWAGGPLVDQSRLRGLVSATIAGPLDGLLGSGVAGGRIPGISPEYPISASRLQTLLRCPHWFLFQTVLGWEEPAAPPNVNEIESLAYGSLLHRVAERFSREHGAAFGRRESSLSEWLAEAESIANRGFEEFLEEYPLAGEGVRRQQRERLRRDFLTFVKHDWANGKQREFFAVEFGFGRDEPMAIELPSGPLYVRGFIDRIDVEDGRALVRDLKSGRSHPRFDKEQNPSPDRDVQLALYGMVVAKLAKKLELPPQVAGAYAYMDVHDPERSFRKDFAALEKIAGGWLDAASSLLRRGWFPRTPVEEDCKYCPFTVVCGPGVRELATRAVTRGGAALGAFAALKDPPDEGGDEE
ncbi:MAG: PD-(D/E)XK nuclease family protein [Gammaproteobacteria bacterium]